MLAILRLTVPAVGADFNEALPSKFKLTTVSAATLALPPLKVEPSATLIVAPLPKVKL